MIVWMVGRREHFEVLHQVSDLPSLLVLVIANFEAYFCELVQSSARFLFQVVNAMDLVAQLAALDFVEHILQEKGHCRQLHVYVFVGAASFMLHVELEGDFLCFLKVIDLLDAQR